MKKLLLIFMLIIFGMFISGCNSQELTSNDDKIIVVTTLFPLYEFAKEVGGENVEVTLLLPPGTESHSFEPRPSDIIKMNNADLFLYIGEDMEPWAHNVIEGLNNDKLLVLDASSKVKLLKSVDDHGHDHDDDHAHDHDDDHAHDHDDDHAHDHDDDYVNDYDDSDDDHHHGEYDPHIWLDFENNIKIVNAIAEYLSKIDDVNKDVYMQNAVEYNLLLQKLDQRYFDELSDCKHDEFITGGHNAFRYLANRYNLETISAYGISPNSEPTPQRIKTIVDITTEHNIKYIYFEKLVNPRMAETLAREAKAETLILNPGHNLQKDEFDKGVTFISLMEENLESLKIGLECN
jgi:zinc transport system substrate-binding protein